MEASQLEHVNHKYNTNVPLVLMSSFNTDKVTDEVMSKHIARGLNVSSFTQRKLPRMNKDETLVTATYASSESNWYPPGPGDVYEMLQESGKLDEFMNQGIEIVFIAEIENLGAKVDARIADYMLKNNVDYVMEVSSALSGNENVVIRRQGALETVHSAQVAKSHREELADKEKFPLRNTNNIW